ncbi:MAG: hypothetical protein HY240_09010 [Actinobacteria bacterium]|nr:hypothetical protein [Actinomycetota bacterium]
MLELAATEAVVVVCAADEAATDAAIGAADAAIGAFACRTAPDEALLVGPPGAARGLVAAATERAVAADPDAVVLDATDGWAVWTLEGDGVPAAFSRLSALRLPAEGFVQGDVARVPVKLVARPGRLHLLVPAMWREHLREQILDRCGDLGLSERAEAAKWEDPG